VGLWNYIQLPARGGLISVVTVCSLRGDTGTIHTFAASPHQSLLAIESLIQSLLESLHESLFDSLLERVALQAE
jgi:hypothetical protein